MRILLNGAPRECDADITLAALLDETGYGQRRVAIEVNREIVPRGLRVEYILNEGDRIEIVQAIGGG